MEIKDNIDEINNFLSTPIPKVEDQIKWNEFGFFVKNGLLQGIGFYNQSIEGDQRLFFNKLTINHSLKILSLVYCNLAYIPDIIDQLTELIELYIGGNGFTEITKSIGNLTKLRILYIIEDKLEEIPNSILDLPQLEELVISTSNIDVLPKQFLKLKKRECKVVFNNEIV